MRSEAMERVYTKRIQEEEFLLELEVRGGGRWGRGWGWGERSGRGELRGDGGGWFWVGRERNGGGFEGFGRRNGGFRKGKR